MTNTEIIAELEQLKKNPLLSERQQQALRELCQAIEKNDTFETIEKLAQFLASLAAVASYIQHLLS
ncbi:MAG TPA: hypothetical protein VHE34_21290 [Puia sp.]|uniref:hypothetical protein n=1 Tax=Puia sp. TaxID=2045100 RepID=UPI002BDEF912|nr:hypothetical protein [Puia sp.]HVU97779.1 hypothetical protein [Puia sp.]